MLSSVLLRASFKQQISGQSDEEHCEAHLAKQVALDT